MKGAKATALVYLAECRARRHDPVNRDFYWFLFGAAQRARRRAAARPAQLDLFA
jgi:hypothetical protein